LSYPVSFRSVQRKCGENSRHRQINVRPLAERLGVGKEATRKILERDLRKRKISSRFVPNSLTVEQAEHRVECCRSFVEFADQELQVL